MSVASSRTQTTRPSVRIDPILEAEGVRAVRIGRGVRGEYPRLIVGVDHRSPDLRVGGHLLDGDTRQLLGAGSDVLGERPRGIGGIDALDVEDRWALLDQRPERELGLAQALLGVAARAHVREEAEEIVQVPLRVEDRRRDVVHPHPVTIGVVHPILVVEHLEVGVVEGIDRPEVREIVRVHQFEPEPCVVEESLRREAEDRFHLWADEAHRRDPVGPHEVRVGDGRDQLHHRAVSSLGLTQASLRLHLHAHVHHEALPVPDTSVVVVDRAGLVAHPHPAPVGRSHAVDLIEIHPRRERESVRRLDAFDVVGMHGRPPPGPIVRRSLRWIAEERLDLRADEGDPSPLVVMGLRVGHRGVLRDELLVPGFRLEPATLGALSLDGRSEHARHGAERVELVSRPSPFHETVVEADEGPPGAVHEDRERCDRHDLLADELRSLLLGEVANEAVDRLLVRHEADPSVEAVAAHPGSVQGGIPELGRDVGGAPLRVLGHQIVAVTIGLHEDQIGPGDLPGETEMPQDVIDRSTPVGRQEQALGREGDGGEHRIASHQLLLIPDRSSQRGSFRPGMREPAFRGLLGLSARQRTHGVPSLGSGRRPFGGLRPGQEGREAPRAWSRRRASRRARASADETWPPA